MTEQIIQTEAEAQQEENKLIAQRREKLQSKRDSGEQAFPNDFRRNAYAQDLQDKYAEHDKEQLAGLGDRAAVAGRIMLNRGAFMVIQDMSGRIQL